MLDQLTITLTSAINAEGRIKYYFDTSWMFIFSCHYLLVYFLFILGFFTLFGFISYGYLHGMNRQSHHSILCT